MEKLVKEHIIGYMKKNKFFSKKQCGFMNGCSTTLQLLTVLDKWTEALDAGHSIDCVYMDYAKAFNTVLHGRLIYKLSTYSITEDVVSWINSFLSNRIQQVVIHGQEPTWRSVTSGIPQGSVLGPLLFVIFINDLPNCVSSDAYLFTDDTKIFRIITKEKDKEALQQDIEKLDDWSKKWLLKFHPQKCKYMAIGKNDAQFK